MSFRGLWSGVGAGFKTRAPGIPHSFVWFSALLSTAGLGSCLVPASSILCAAKPQINKGKLGPESSCKPLSPAGCRRRRPRTSDRGVGRRGPGPAPPAAATSARCRGSRTDTPPSRPAPTQSPPSETNEQACRTRKVSEAPPAGRSHGQRRSCQLPSGGGSHLERGADVGARDPELLRLLTLRRVKHSNHAPALQQPVSFWPPNDSAKAKR